MRTYIVFSDRETFADLDRCVILLPTEEQEKRYAKALAITDLRPLAEDPDVERIEFSLAFLCHVLRSKPPRS